MTESALRRVSLALAAMHWRDRRWMLARLPKALTQAWRRHAKDAVALVRRDPVTAMGSLTGWALPVNIEVPEPLVLIRSLDKLPAAWAARSLALIAPDHADVYRAVCRPQRLADLQREAHADALRVPPALAHALAAALKRLGSESDDLEGNAA